MWGSLLSAEGAECGAGRSSARCADERRDEGRMWGSLLSASGAGHRRRAQPWHNLQPCAAGPPLPAHKPPAAVTWLQVQRCFMQQLAWFTQHCPCSHGCAAQHTQEEVRVEAQLQQHVVAVVQVHCMGSQGAAGSGAHPEHALSKGRLRGALHSRLHGDSPALHVHCLPQIPPQAAQRWGEIVGRQQLRRSMPTQAGSTHERACLPPAAWT